jgi:phage shock protein A
MNLLERVLMLLGANLNAMIEKADDPEQVLRQLQVDMRNQLMQVKTQVATAIAESHKLQKRHKEKATDADTWLKKAERAVQQKNDDAARSALAHYNDLLRQAQRYQQLQQEQDQLVSTMRGALRQLEGKISEVETTLDLLVTRKRNALLQQRVYEALQKTGDVKERERARQAQDAVIEAEARARALADLHRRDLDTQLGQLSEEAMIEQQMEDLKAKNQARKTQPLLHEGHPQAAPLIPPDPRLAAPVQQQDNAASDTSSPPAHPQRKEVDAEQLQKLLDSLRNNP